MRLLIKKMCIIEYGSPLKFINLKITSSLYITKDGATATTTARATVCRRAT